MINKTKRGLLFALLASLGMAGAQAQTDMIFQDHDFLSIENATSPFLTAVNPVTPIVHDNAWYEQAQFNYNWTDANGISHTSKFTDKATDPYQIIELLRMAYCNPNVPGLLYSTEFNGEVYYGSIGCGWNISSSDVVRPYDYR